MNKAQLVHSIRHSYELFDRLGRARLFRRPTSFPSHREFNEYALDVSADYVDTFLCGLRLTRCNVFLHDFSYFQFGPREVRLALHPPPFGPTHDDTIFAACDEAQGPSGQLWLTAQIFRVQPAELWIPSRVDAEFQHCHDKITKVGVALIIA